jgi:hypothetical protein
LAKVSLKGSGKGLASAPGVVPESAVEVDVVVLVVVAVGGASPMGAGGVSPIDDGGASAFGVGGTSAFAVDEPSMVDVDVAAPSRVRMAIAVCGEQACSPKTSPTPRASERKAALRLAFKATGFGTTLSFSISAVAQLRLEGSPRVANRLPVIIERASVRRQGGFVRGFG